MTELWTALAPKLWTASWQAAVLALLVGGVLKVVGHHFSPHWRNLLWLVPFLRLMLPELPPNPVSLFQWIPAPEKVWEEPAARITEPAAIPMPDTTTLAEETPPSTTLAPNLRWLWFLGFSFFGSIWLLRMWRHDRFLRTCVRLEDARLHRLLEEGVEKFGLVRKPVLLGIPNGKSAAVGGLFRSYILLGSDLAGRDDATLRDVLWHELSHLKRKDIPVLALAQGVCLVHWFNPAAWWTLHRLRAESEMAADDLALSHLPTRHNAYAETLFEILSLQASPLLASPGMAGRPSDIQERFQQIFSQRPRPWMWGVSLTIFIFLLLIGLTEPGHSSNVLSKGDFPEGGPSDSPAITVEIESRFFNFEENPGIPHPQILSPGRTAELIRKMLEIPGCDLMTTPSFTLRPGQKGTVKVAREFRYPSAYRQEKNGLTPTDFTQTDVGVILDFTPTVRGAQVTLEKKIVLREFLGFQRHDNGALSPVFQTKEIPIKMDLLSGQSVLYYAPTGTSPSTAENLQKSPEAGPGRKHTYVLITATLVEAPKDTLSPEPPETAVSRLPKVPARVSAVNLKERFVVINQGSAGGLATGDLRGVRRDGQQLLLVQVDKPETDSALAYWTDSSAAWPQPGDLIDYPEAVLNERGFAISPYAPKAGEIDLRNIPRGTQVKCPYTGKLFLVP